MNIVRVHDEILNALVFITAISTLAMIEHTDDVSGEKKSTMTFSLVHHTTTGTPEKTLRVLTSSTQLITPLPPPGSSSTVFPLALSSHSNP